MATQEIVRFIPPSLYIAIGNILKRRPSHIAGNETPRLYNPGRGVQSLSEAQFNRLIFKRECSFQLGNKSIILMFHSSM